MGMKAGGEERARRKKKRQLNSTPTAHCTEIKGNCLDGAGPALLLNDFEAHTEGDVCGATFMALRKSKNTFQLLYLPRRVGAR